MMDNFLHFVVPLWNNSHKKQQSGTHHSINILMYFNASGSQHNRRKICSVATFYYIITSYITYCICMHLMTIYII